MAHPYPYWLPNVIKFRVRAIEDGDGIEVEDANPVVQEILVCGSVRPSFGYYHLRWDEPPEAFMDPTDYGPSL